MLGRVSIVVDAAMANFESDMGRASRVAEKNFKKMERDAEEMHRKMVQVGTAVGLAITGAMAAATSAVRSQINAMDDLSKAAQRAQMPTDDFSRLAYAGELADVSMQDLTGSMGKLAKAQGEALKGTGATADVFRKLKIDVANADGSLRSTQSVFMDFAREFERHKGSPEIMAAGMQIFGRSFQNLIPLLKDGEDGLRAAAEEADRLGITLSTEAGEQAEAFNDNITRLHAAVTGLWREVANQLLPQLLDLSETFFGTATKGDHLKESATSIADAFRGIGSVVGVLVSGMKIVSGTVRGVMFDMIALANATQGALRVLKWDFKGAGDSFRNAAIARGMAADASNDIDNVFRSPAPSAPRVIMADGNNAPDGFFKKRDRRQSGGFEEAEVAAKSNGRATKAIRERASATKEVMTLEEEWQVIQDVWDQATIDRSNREADAWARQTEVVEESTNMMSVYAEQAARNMQDAFADFLIDPLKNGFKGLLGSFADMLKKMAAQAAASKIFEAFGNWASGYSGGGAGWVNAIGAAIKGGRAIGGKVAAGSMYEVTEGGASELLRDGQGRTYLIPGSDGTVIPASDMRGGQAMGGASVTVNIHNAPGGADVQSKRNGSGGFDIDVILKQIEGGIASNVAAGASPINASLQGRYGLRTAV